MFMNHLQTLMYCLQNNREFPSGYIYKLFLGFFCEKIRKNQDTLK